ncbi:MAG: Calx-beta domain-containing protein, partial [Planctomycetota bacterium]
MLLSNAWKKRRQLRGNQSRRAASRRRASADIRPATELLEVRTLLTTSTLFADGELNVIIDEGNDSVAIQTDPLNPAFVQVLVNNTLDRSLPPILAGSVARITIIGSDSENIIDLSTIARADFSYIDPVTGSSMEIEVDAGNGHDTILASVDFDDSLSSGHGNDAIDAALSLGRLTIDGGDGNDTITAGAGADTIHAGDGDDLVDAGSGDDIIQADDGADTVAAGDGIDFVDGGTGADVISGGGNADSLIGGDGNDSIDAGDGDDTLRGGALDDTLIGGVGADVLTGNSGNDVLDGGISNDLVNGGNGNDTLFGAGGDDLLLGGRGNDSLDGGLDNDRVLGGAGSDTATGGRGEDTVLGQGGADTVVGGGDGDEVHGGAGNDVVESGERGDEGVGITISDVQLSEGDGFILTGGFAFPSTLSPFFGTAGDFDGDGDQDLAIPAGRPTGSTTPTPGEIRIFLNDGTGIFTPAGSAIFASDSFEPVLDSGDLNGDGLDDLVVSSFFSGEAVVYLSTGGGTIGTPVRIGIAVGVLGVRLADMNGDGDLDVVATTPGAQGGVFSPDTLGQVFVSQNNGSGGFGPATGVNAVGGNTFNQSRQFDVGDVNGDGSVDVVVANEALGNVSVLTNDGTGALTVLGTAATSEPPARVDLGDLDGDGDLDAVVTHNLNGGTVLPRSASVFLNNGTGTFTLGSVITASTSAAFAGGLFVVDVDSDGDDDVMLGSSAGQAFFRNDGAANLVEEAFFGPTGFPVDIDFDGDGRIDFVAQSATGFDTYRNNFIGPQTASVVVSLDAASSVDVSVDFSTISATATADVDFMSVGGTLVFPAGTTTQTIDIPIINELVIEPDESFLIQLSNPVNGILLDAQAQATLFDDDNGPAASTVALSDVSVPEGEAVTDVVLTLTRSGDSTGSGSVDISSIDGSALGGSDFVIPTGTATFGPGDTTATVTIQIVGDTRAEGTEQFQITLINPVNVVIANTTATVTILDDDGAPAPPLLIDTLSGGSGRDTVNGGDNADLIIGNSGNDQLNGGGDNDTIYGGAGNDTLNGGAGDDSLIGNSGADVPIGGEGDDTIVWRGDRDGNDEFTAELGFDTLQIQGNSQDNEFTVSQSGSTLLISERNRAISLTGDLLGFASGAEQVVIHGNGGDDTVTIDDINDVGFFVLIANGGAGADTISAAGADIGNVPLVLNGDGGSDTITGSTGIDSIFGGDGDDQVDGGAGDDQINGNDGDDALDGGAGDDAIFGDLGVDILIGGLGNDLLDGGFGNDMLDGSDGDDSLFGGFGDDFLLGSDGD